MAVTREADSLSQHNAPVLEIKSGLVPAFFASLLLFVIMYGKKEMNGTSSMHQLLALRGNVRPPCSEKYGVANISMDVNGIAFIHGSMSKDITLCKESDDLNIFVEYPMYLYISITSYNGNILSDCLPSAKAFESIFEGHPDEPRGFYSCPLGYLPSGKYNITILRIRGHPDDVTNLHAKHFYRDSTEISNFVTYTYDKLGAVQVSKTSQSDLTKGYWMLTRCSDISKVLGYRYCESQRNEYFFSDQHLVSSSPRWSCLNTTNVTLVGDSRMEHLHQQLEKMFPNGSFFSRPTNHLLSLSNQTHKSMFIGLQGVFKLGIDAEIYEHLIQGETVMFNSILHDLADFPDQSSTFKIRFTVGLDHCGHCVGSAIECKCQEKSDAVQNYIENIKRLGDIIAMAKRFDNSGRFIWISHGIIPPFVGNDHTKYGGRIFKHDLLHYLESFAGNIVIKNGGEHLDLRPMLRSAPRSWWYDMVHYARPLDAPLSVSSAYVISRFLCDNVLMRDQY
jgi:hypothetical protein